MATDSVQAVPTPRVLLCLDACHGEFYLPLDWDDAPVCPNDRTHDVAVYGGVVVHRYCNECGAELGLIRAGRDVCAKCEGVDV